MICGIRKYFSRPSLKRKIEVIHLQTVYSKLVEINDISLEIIYPVIYFPRPTKKET